MTGISGWEKNRALHKTQKSQKKYIRNTLNSDFHPTENAESRPMVLTPPKTHNQLSREPQPLIEGINNVISLKLLETWIMQASFYATEFSFFE